MDEDDKCPGCKYRDEEIHELRRKDYNIRRNNCAMLETARDAMKSVLRIYQAHGHRPYAKNAWTDD